MLKANRLSSQHRQVPRNSSKWLATPTRKQCRGQLNRSSRRPRVLLLTKPQAEQRQVLREPTKLQLDKGKLIRQLQPPQLVRLLRALLLLEVLQVLIKDRLQKE